MKYSTITTLITLLGLTASKQITANYDDETVDPAVPALNTLHKYKDLSYTGFALNEVGLDGTGMVAGIKPESSPINIVSGFEQTSVAGTLAGLTVKGTKTKSFDFKSFYYGCSVNTAEGAEGLPQQCTINVRGFKKVTDKVAHAHRKFTFNPKLTKTAANPVKAVLGKAFQNIERVEFIQLESASGEELNVLVLDDLEYDTHMSA